MTTEHRLTANQRACFPVAMVTVLVSLTWKHDTELYYKMFWRRNQRFYRICPSLQTNWAAFCHQVAPEPSGSSSRWPIAGGPTGSGSERLVCYNKQNHTVRMFLTGSQSIWVKAGSGSRTRTHVWVKVGSGRVPEWDQILQKENRNIQLVLTQISWLWTYSGPGMFWVLLNRNQFCPE